MAAVSNAMAASIAAHALRAAMMTPPRSAPRTGTSSTRTPTSVVMPAALHLGPVWQLPRWSNMGRPAPPGERHRLQGPIPEVRQNQLHELIPDDDPDVDAQLVFQLRPPLVLLFR